MYICIPLFARFISPFFKFIAPLRERIRRRLGLPSGPGISLDTL